MKQRNLLVCLALVSLVFLLFGNSLLPITDPVESNYALTAKEMVQAGDWFSPRIYGTFWYDKPIFIYWLLCLSYTVFGFTDFASRLPGGLFGMASVVIMAWYTLRRTGKTTTAVVTAAMTATSLEVWAVSHSIITDQMLFFFTAGTMFFAYIGLTERKGRYMIAAYAMSAFAVLTKGPVGIVLPGLFLLVFAGTQRNFSYFKRIFNPAGIVLFCLVSLPWYSGMYLLHGQAFIDGFLGLNNVVRATVSEHPNVNVWYYYIVLVPVSLLPWTGPCLYALWQKRSRNDDYMFMAIWSLGTILFYSCMATKYPTYSFIANIPLLILGAEAVMTLCQDDRRKMWTLLTGPAIFYWLLLLGASFALKFGGPWTWLYIFMPIAAIALIFAQWHRAAPAIPAIITLGTIIIYGIVMTQGLAPYYNYRSASDASAMTEYMKGDFYMFGDYRTSFVYYTGREAALVELSGRNKNAELHRSNVWAKKHLYKEAAFDTVLDKVNRHEAVSILVPAADYQDYLGCDLFNQTRYVGQFGTNHLFVTK